MFFIDLKKNGSRCHPSTSRQKEMAYEFREDGVCPTDGFSPPVRIPQMCGSVPGQLQGQELFLLGPVPLHGFCATDLPGKLAGYRSLPSGSPAQTVPSRNTRQGLPEYPGQRQPGAGLAYLCRFCPDPHWKSPEAVYPRLFRHRAPACGVCPGLHHHRPLSVSLPLGSIQKTQRGDQDPYASGSAGQYSYGGGHHPWESARCEHPRPDRHRTRGLLCRRSRVSRFCPSSQDTHLGSVLCHTGETEFSVPPSLFAEGRQIDRHSLRSDCRTGELLRQKGLPFQAPKNPVLRFEKQQASCLSHQQSYLALPDHRRYLPLSVAHRALFQMDQAAPPDKAVSYTHLQAHETRHDLVCRLLLEKKKKTNKNTLTSTPTKSRTRGKS